MPRNELRRIEAPAESAALIRAHRDSAVVAFVVGVDREHVVSGVGCNREHVLPFGVAHLLAQVSVRTGPCAALRCEEVAHGKERLPIAHESSALDGKVVQGRTATTTGTAAACRTAAASIASGPRFTCRTGGAARATRCASGTARRPSRASRAPGRARASSAPSRAARASPTRRGTVVAARAKKQGQRTQSSPQPDVDHDATLPATARRSQAVSKRLEGLRLREPGQ